MKLHPSPAETIVGLSRALRTRERTCVSVVEQCLAQIDAWETTVKAWVRIDRDGALNHARDLDRELADGKCRGPLHGIPVGIKDLFDVAGWPTLAGAPWLSAVPASADAPIVARLRSAGAIVLGKTVTTQFACFDPPPTRNPWNLEHTPGGSSSGSAAAVATGMCLGAIGSQTGGSIIRPASFCGVAGCKPTYGLVPLQGVYPLAASMDHAGPIARTVEDLAILLEAIVSPLHQMAWRAAHPSVPSSAIGFAVWSGSARSPASPFPLPDAVRLGRPRGLFADRAEAAAVKVFDAALDRISELGATVSDVVLPVEFDDVLECHRVIITFEAAQHHRPLFAEHAGDYLPCIRGLIEEGMSVAPEEYARCKFHQEALSRDVAAAIAGVDVLVCPATVGPAPTCDTTGDPAFNAPWSYTGLPTVSFPIGLSTEGLPLSIQLVGRPHDEATLFGVAQWCERQLSSATNRSI